MPARVEKAPFEGAVLCLPRASVAESLGPPAGFHRVRPSDLGPAFVGYRWVERCDDLEKEPGEANAAWVQVIPYCLFVRRGPSQAPGEPGPIEAAWTYRRGSGEARLAKELSLGIGGHVEPADQAGGVTSWAATVNALAREVEEEVETSLVVEGVPPPRPLFAGVLWSGRREVDRAHLGLCFVDSARRPMSAKDGAGVSPHGWVSSRELLSMIHDFEQWSRDAIGALLPAPAAASSRLF